MSSRSFYYFITLSCDGFNIDHVTGMLCDWFKVDHVTDRSYD